MAITEVDEKLLVQAYQAGDVRAFDTIVRTQWKALYAHAIRRLNDHDAAEDAVQDTLLRAYRALPNLTGDLALRAWLHRILTNVCHDEGNRRRRLSGLVEKVSALPEELAPDPVDEALLHDTVRVMSEALEDLPDSYREALVLRYVDGLSFREVAEVAGITEENARARVHRGRVALHKVMTRIAVVLAFLVPGLRRTQQPAPGTEAAAATAGSEGGVQLVTQLTSHAVNAAPTISRFSEIAMATSGSKSAFVTTAVAAVAAVAVPVTAYTVHETSKPPSKPAAVAAPFDDDDATTATTAATTPVEPVRERSEALVVAAEATTSTTESTTTSTTPSTTSTTVPPSAAHPFESPQPDAPAEETQPAPAAPGTAEPAEPADEPAAEPAATILATLSGSEITASGDGPNADVSGPIRLDERDGTLGGRLTIHDDDQMAAELTVVIDGTSYSLRLRGGVVERADDGTVRFAGKFSFPGAAALGLPEAGDVVSGSFRRAEGPGSSLVLELEGPPPESAE